MGNRVVLRLAGDDHVLRHAEAAELFDLHVGIRLALFVQIVAQELVERAVKEITERDQLIHLGGCRSGFPFGYRLARYVHLVRQRFLRKVSVRFA